MLPPAAAQAIKDRLRTGFTALPIAWPNEEFKRPVDPETSEVLPYVVAEMPGGRYDQESTGAPGANVIRTDSAIALHVYVRRNTGDDQALQWCKELRDLFRGQDVGGCEFRGGQLYPGEDGDADGLYWRRTVVIQFRFDELG